MTTLDWLITAGFNPIPVHKSLSIVLIKVKKKDKKFS